MRDLSLFSSFGGVRLFSSDLLVVGPFEDWTQVRSPGRARRRRAKYPQRIRLYYKPDPNVIHDRIHGTIIGHPATLDRLRRSLEARMTPDTPFQSEVV